MQQKLLKNKDPRELYQKETSRFLDYLSFFAREIKKGIPEEIASLNAFKAYKIFMKTDDDDCIKENFELYPLPCSFKKRWREYLIMKFPNLLFMYIIDTITEMLDVDLVETGRRLSSFIPLLKKNLETSDGWKLLCQKPELQMLREAFELPVVISNLSIGDAWLLVFLLRHFNVLPEEIKEWRYSSSVLDSALPLIIRDYTNKLLVLKYILPNLQKEKKSVAIDWKKSIPIHFPCPKCRPVTNLSEKEWGYIQLHTPDSLSDYHHCPQCKKVWAIRHAHTDECLWNLK